MNAHGKCSLAHTQLRAMMPHSKKDTKLDGKDKPGEVLPEVDKIPSAFKVSRLIFPSVILIVFFLVDL